MLLNLGRQRLGNAPEPAGRTRDNRPANRSEVERLVTRLDATVDGLPDDRLVSFLATAAEFRMVANALLRVQR